MELVIWGLLIGMVGMVWLLVAASLQDEGKQSERTDAEREEHPSLENQASSTHSLRRRAKAAA